MDTIVELKTDDEWREALPALLTLRPKLRVEDLLKSKPELIERGYQLVGIVRSKQIVTVAGFVIQPHLEFGRELWVHDPTTHPTYQRQGYARTLLRWLRTYAQKQECFRISVHTRLHREGAHRFYEDSKMIRTAVVYQAGVESSE